MSPSEIETKLEALAQAWPGKSVARDVTARVAETAQRSTRRHRTGPRVYPWIGAVVASLVLMAAGFWAYAPRSLQAALQECVRQSGKVYVLKERFDGNEITKGEIWYHCDHGIRMEGMGHVTVDDGKVSRTWSPEEPGCTVLVRPSMDGVTMIAEMLDMSRMPSHWLNHRMPEGDQKVMGSSCRAYVVNDRRNEAAGDPVRRTIVLLDGANRPRRVIQQLFNAGVWKDTDRTTVDYDREIIAKVFQLDYPANAKIVDVQTALDARFPLSEAVAKMDKDALQFAVHDLLRIDDGSYYVVSSVRGSPAYLQNYPPRKRRLNLNYTALDVASQTHSHCSVDGGLQVIMFHMEWQGVDYLWWLMVPSNRHREAAARTVSIPLVGNHLHPDRRDSRGVQLQTRVVLETPLKHAGSSTLEQTIAKARSDMKLVSAVFGETESLPIAKSIKESVQFTTFDDITNEAYAAELLKTRWQLQTGDFTGTDPPKNADGTIAWETQGDVDAEVEPQPPRPKLSGEPTPLPATITGQVVNASKQPVAKAKITLHIRRFNTRQDEIQSRGLELDGPGPWNAVTDDQGNYSISPSGTFRPAIDEVRIKVVAEGYADASIAGDPHDVLQGSLSPISFLKGRRIHGRVVDAQGNAVTSAIVRFQSNNEDFTGMWDSGPFSVDAQGQFSLAIPGDGTAAGAVYPANFAPRFIDVTDAADQGDVVLEKGVSLKGRVVDKNGRGVAKTVVGIRNTDYRVMHAFMVVIGTAVKTNEQGYFQLPQLSGSYILSVADAIPDFSRQLRILGATPPTIESQTINSDELDPSKLIVLRED